MAQEYELTEFQAGDFKDAHGNTWATAVFLGEGEPVKWVVKDPATIKVGQKYYGTITEEKSKAGKPYLRFRREKVPEGSPSVSNNDSTDDYWAAKQNQIKAQWAIGQAVQFFMSGRNTAVAADEIQTIESYAKDFYAMVDRVANPKEEEIDRNDVDIVNLEDLPL